MNSWFIRTLTFCAAALCTYSANADSAETSVKLTVYTYDSFNSDWGPGPSLKTDFEKNCDCTLKFVTTDDAVSILNRLR